MKIALVGAGRVASCMGPRLKEAGHIIAGVYSRTLKNAEELAGKVDAPASDKLDQLPEADVYLTMLSDDALIQLAPVIVKGREKALFIHTAGSVPMNVWKEACSDVELEAIRRLALDLSPDVTPLSSKGRKKLHIAAVFACNFTNHMYAVSEQILAEEGIPFSVMLPLVRETARKVEGMSPLKAQTGPAVRGDRKVVNEHLDLLKDNPEYAGIYRLISTDINKELK